LPEINICEKLKIESMDYQKLEGSERHKQTREIIEKSIKRAAEERLNQSIGDGGSEWAKSIKNNWEPKVEFRHCREHIIDFIRRHDYIICVQNYLYDEGILEELSKKSKVECILQYQEWMSNKNDKRTKVTDTWMLKSPFEGVKAILENRPSMEENQRRICHHKFFLGTTYLENNNLDDYKKVNLLYGTYNITYAAKNNLESTMEFSGTCHPKTIRSFINESNKLSGCVSGFDYAKWARNNREINPFELINEENTLKLRLFEIAEILSRRCEERWAITNVIEELLLELSDEEQTAIHEMRDEEKRYDYIMSHLCQNNSTQAEEVIACMEKYDNNDAMYDELGDEMVEIAKKISGKVKGPPITITIPKHLQHFFTKVDDNNDQNKIIRK